MSKHYESIKAGKFNAKFRNTLRDYYTYGYKTYANVQNINEDGEMYPSVYTIDDDWKRLENLLSRYFEWTPDKKEVLFLSTDSQSMVENPFHRIYRFCRFNQQDPKAFFNIIMALSADFNLARGLDSIDMDYPPEDIIGDRLTSAQLLCYYPDGRDVFRGENNTINNKLQELNNLGIIVDEPIVSGNKKTHRWRMSDYYIDDIIEQGKKVDKDFDIHFSDALDFFSRYEVLGVLGNLILNRVNPNFQSVFRFKHEYYMQSINDYNVIDLITAIKEQKWCKIDYTPSSEKKTFSLICMPLELRISSSNGREYLSFYEPFSRSYSNLRLEFIDEIAYIKDGSINKPNGELISLENEIVKADISNAKVLLEHSWGASTTISEIGNVKGTPHLYDVYFSISYNPDTEKYILDRVLRERRIAEVIPHNNYIEVFAKVSDYREMYPWIRTFYSRLLKYSCMDDSNSIVEDIKLIEEKYKKSEVLKSVSDNQKKDEFLWKIPSGIKYEITYSTAHTSLFNEMFSIYYDVISDVLMKLFSNENKDRFTENEMKQIVLISIQEYKKNHKLGRKSKEILENEILDIVKSSAFFQEGFDNGYGVWIQKSKANFDDNKRKEYMRRFKTTKKSFFSSILPLSKYECEWLRYVVNEPKMYMFLSDNEINYLKSKLSYEDNNRLPLNFVKNKDRFINKSESIQNEIRYTQLVLKAIRNKSEVYITYKTGCGNILKKKYQPLYIEYSKRDNLFRCFAYSRDEDKISIINIGRIQECILDDISYDNVNALSKLNEYRKLNMQSITLVFCDEKNVPDRILNEFAPWKKKCVYNTESGMFRLTIYYQKQDAYELAIRILGYGPYVRTVDEDSDNVVYKQLNMRLQRQNEIKISDEKARS
jgi:hypothetical protein